ncbi:MAG: hypothetical protein QOJ79_2887 [Actinomycetota bacterium]|jgi:hypothetical protein|nr:hypothetical protein [Actinomycetota bacterium]
MTNKWARLGSLSGVLFVLLVIASNVVGGGFPENTESPAKVIAFYQAHKTGQQWSASLTGAAVVVGLYFFGSLRAYLRRSASADDLVVIAFAGAVLFGAAGCVNAGLQWSLAAVPDQLTPAAAQALNVLGKDNLATGFFGAGLATLMLFYGIAMLRTRLLPTWLGWVSVALGVLAVAGPLVFLVFTATAPWAIVVSVLLYMHYDDPAPAVG